MLAYRIGLGEPNQKYEVFEQEPQADADTLNLVLIVEGSRRTDLEQLQPVVAAMAREVLQPLGTLREGLFKLLVSFHDGEAPVDRSQIRAGDALRSRFK